MSSANIPFQDLHSMLSLPFRNDSPRKGHKRPAAGHSNLRVQRFQCDTERQKSEIHVRLSRSTVSTTWDQSSEVHLRQGDLKGHEPQASHKISHHHDSPANPPRPRRVNAIPIRALFQGLLSVQGSMSPDWTYPISDTSLDNEAYTGARRVTTKNNAQMFE